MPQVIRYFEKSDAKPGTYVEITREYKADGTSSATKGKLFRLASDRETGGETAYVPDMATPIRLLPLV
jgi:hypothetical protein